MSERKLRPPHPLPETTDFAAAAYMTNELFETNGGAWVYYYKTTLIDAPYHLETKRILNTISSHSLLVEPREEGLKAVDQSLQATRAFAAGAWTGGILTKFIHEDNINVEWLLGALSRTLPYENYKTYEEYEANGQYLLSIGEEGASMAGYDTRQYFETWAGEIISNEEFRPLYTLGAGAILYSSQEIYKQLYSTLQQEYEISLVSEQASQFLSHMSDSSDN